MGLTKREIIENFIIWFTSDDAEREEMFEALEQYISEENNLDGFENN